MQIIPLILDSVLSFLHNSKLALDYWNIDFMNIAAIGSPKAN